MVVRSMILLLLSGNFAYGEWVRHTIDDSSRGADGVKVMDIDRDGKLDIVTGWEEGDVVRVYLQPEKSKVKKAWPYVTVGEVASPEDAMFVDLDSDGCIDVVSCCEGKTRSVFVHWSPRSDLLMPNGWKTEPFAQVEKKSPWMFCVSADLDAQHEIDLVIGSKGTQGQIGLLRSPKSPRKLAEWTYHKIRDAGWIMSLAMYDVDQDGDQDLVFSDRYGKSRGVFWMENPGVDAVRRDADWREHEIGGLGKEVMFLRIADLERDGVDEIVVTTRIGKLLIFRREINLKNRWKSTEYTLPFGLKHGKSVALGDLDLDGVTDIAFTNRSHKTEKRCVCWRKNLGSWEAPQWQTIDIGGIQGDKFDLIELMDIDADGDLDLLTCEEAHGLGVIWYENPAR